MSTLFEILVAFSLIYFISINLIYTVLTVMSFAHSAFRVRQARAADFDVLLESGLTPPVSIVIPAHNEEPVIVDAVATALAVNYPEFEVIVVNDGSNDRTLRRLIDTFELESSEKPYRAELPSESIRRIYFSPKHPRLQVIDKEQGGKADALNAGVNVSRYRYVCNTDADTIFERDALVRIVRQAVRDPRRIVAMGGQVRVGNGFRVEEGQIVERRLPGSILPNFQLVEYLRTFLANRIGWSSINGMLLISGAFGFWRRDVLVSVGGFNRAITGEDLEITVRMHRVLRERGEEFEVISMPDPVCWTEAPEDVGSFYQQRDRWHRVLLESFFMHSKMLFNPRYGVAGMLAMPYYLFFEILGPFVEIFSYIFVATGVIAGFIDLEILFLFLFFATGYTTLLNAGAIFIEERHYETYRLSEVLKLIGIGFLDNLGYRQFTMGIRVIATFGWLFQTRGWGRIRRTGYSEDEEEGSRDGRRPSTEEEDSTPEAEHSTAAR